jgi:hypothetical protein
MPKRGGDEREVSRNDSESALLHSIYARKLDLRACHVIVEVTELTIA